MDENTLIDVGLRIVSALIGVVVLGWLFASAPATVGQRELRYSGRLKMSAVFCLALAAVIAYGATFAKDSDRIWAYSLFAFFSIGGIYLLLETFSRQVRYDENRLYDKSIWRGTERSLAWAELVEYDYSQMNQWHIFKTGDGMKIRVSALLSGQEEFMDFIERKFRDIGFMED
ncbi:MAG: hypothetical protein QNJ73_04330 [Gammaproteobacteria bacterium]|nr:hypothetical protein [Gammaproteobacteria bacterium]